MRNLYPYPPVSPRAASPLGKGAFKGEILVFRAAVGAGVPDSPLLRYAPLASLGRYDRNGGGLTRRARRLGAPLVGATDCHVAALLAMTMFFTLRLL